MGSATSPPSRQRSRAASSTSPASSSASWQRASWRSAVAAAGPCCRRRRRRASPSILIGRSPPFRAAICVPRAPVSTSSSTWLRRIPKRAVRARRCRQSNSFSPCSNLPSQTAVPWKRSRAWPNSAMSLVNYQTREITCKVVYYGPGRSGKTTNLHTIFGQIPETRRGKMLSLATQTERTLFFDFLPLDLGSISGFTTKLQLYTVPGQVYYQTTRKLVLQGADGVVFVADSQSRQLDENVESFQDLHANLADHAVDARTVPLVIQYNKRDLPQDLILPTSELSDALNFRGVPEFAADALHGPGVFETLRGISELVLKRLSAGAGAGAGAR